MNINSISASNFGMNPMIFVLRLLPRPGRRKFTPALGLLLLAFMVFAPKSIAQSLAPDDFVQYRMAGSAIASQYGGWKIRVSTPVTVVGAPVEVTTSSSHFTIPGGPTLQALRIGRPLLVLDPDGRTERVTPTQVDCDSSANTCVLTATFTALHPGPFYIESATDGLQEAIDDQSSRGGGIVRITPGWAGTASDIVSLSIPSNVLVRDERAGAETWYSQGGSGTVANLTIAQGALSASQLSAEKIAGIFYADQFPGADGGAQINACLKSIPSSGGVCDARGLSPSGASVMAAEDMFAGVTSPFTLLLGGYTLNISAPQTVAVRGAIVGEGPQTILYYSAPSGIAFTFAYPDGTGLAYWVQAGLRNLYLAGSGRSNPTVGVQLGPAQGTSTGVAGITLDHVAIRQFGTNVQMGNNAYSIHFAHVFIEDATTGVSIPAGLQNSGEQISFNSSFIADSGTGIDIKTLGTELLAVNTSFDYNSGPSIQMSAAGNITLTGCHFEDNTQQPFIKASSGSVTINGGFFLANVPSARSIASGSRGSNIVTITTTTPHQFTVGQAVIVSGTSDPSMNGSFTISSVPAADTFTYSDGGPDGTTAGGLATLDWQDYVQISGTAALSVMGTQVGSWGSRLDQFVDFTGSGSLDLLGVQGMPIAASTGSGVVALSNAPAGTPGLIADHAQGLLQNGDSKNVFTGAVIVGGQQTTQPSLVAVQAPSQATDLFDARNSSGTNLFSVTSNGTTRVASEGSGSSVSRNGISFSTQGNRTVMQWQNYGNTNGPYFAVDPTNNLALVVGTNGQDLWSLDSAGNWAPVHDNNVNIGSSNGPRPANIYAANSLVAPQITVGTDATFTSSPRMTWTAFASGTINQQETIATLTPDRSIVVTRVEVQATQAPANCTSNASVQLSTGSPLISIPVSSNYADSGSLALVVAGGTPFHIVTTAGTGCSTWPQNLNVVVQYRMN